MLQLIFVDLLEGGAKTKGVILLIQGDRIKRERWAGLYGCSGAWREQEEG